MKVVVQFNYLDVLEVDDIRFTITLKMDLDVRWTEPRLIGPVAKEGNKIPLNLKLMEYLWLPDLDILNVDVLHSFDLLTSMAGNATMQT